MTAPSNLSFETVDTTPANGGALGWTATWTSSYEAYADFTLGGGTAPWESFEGGWSNDTYLFLFADDTTHLARGSFDGSATPSGFESFNLWNSGQVYITALGGTTAAIFGSITPEAFENFEAEWSNTVYSTAFGTGDLTQGVFNSLGTPTAYEGFEAGWSNDAYAMTFSGTAMVFGSMGTGTTHTYESFEPVSPATPFVVSLTLGVFTAPGNNLANGDGVTIVAASPPAPLQALTTYYVRDVSGSTFKLALASGGLAISITGPPSNDAMVLPDPRTYWTVQPTTI